MNQAKPMDFTAIYLHIPFCLRKCQYCDFYSLPLGENRSHFMAYPSLLEREWQLWQEKGASCTHLRSIYFGGGTPSLLPPEAIDRILRLFPAAEEITLEANPETVQEEKLRDFRSAGGNRLSIGVQSFDPNLLKAMGRGHSPAQAKEAVRAARAAGFTNVGIDLIYALPGQTMVQWKQTLAEALALETEHISLYSLTVSEDCPWGKKHIKPLDEDTAADMAELAIRLIKDHGFHHYEIANFSKPGYESRHNTVYWQRENYLGLGPGAASCYGTYRRCHTPAFPQYAAALAKGELPPAEEEYLSQETVLSEAMFLGLRMLDGVNVAAYEYRYGVNPRQRFKEAIRRLCDAQLLEDTGEVLRLSEKGLLLADVVFREFVS